MKKIFLLLCLIGNLSQNSVANECNTLVGGSDFITNSSSSLADFSETIQVGPSINTFYSDIDLATSATDFQDSAKNVYCVTTNPHLLDTSYVDVNQNMVVAHIAYDKDNAVSANTKLFSFKVTDIKKESNFKVTFKLWCLNDTICGIGRNTTPWTMWSIIAGINMNNYGRSNCDVSELYEITPGKNIDVTLEGTLTGNTDYIDLTIGTGYNYVLGSTFGISDLRIYSCPNSKINSSNSSSCIGSYRNLSLSKDYGDAEYQWMEAKEGSGTFAEIGNSKTLEYQITTDSAKVFCLVNGNSSDTLTIYGERCEDSCGATLVKKDLYYDDFGYFSDLRTYTDAFGTTTTFDDTYAPERADVTFDLTALTGEKFDKSGQINDGMYGVVVPSPTGYYQDISGNSRAPWMAGVSSDHSSLITGKDGGAALFMNTIMNFSGSFFTKTFNGIENNKTYCLETYIANLSGGTDPEVTIAIINPANGDTLSSATETAVAEAGWTRVYTQFNTEDLDLDSLKISIASSGTGNINYWNQGNDLIVDDIRFSVLTLPMPKFVDNVIAEGNNSYKAIVDDLKLNSLVGPTSENLSLSISLDGKTWFTEVPTFDYKKSSTDTLKSEIYIKQVNACGSESEVAKLTLLVPPVTGIENADNTITNYYTENGKVYITAKAGSIASLYDVKGQLLDQEKTNDNMIVLNAKGESIVLLKIGKETKKLLLNK